jgi:NADH-quinone oxidoreductase subunit L
MFKSLLFLGAGSVILAVNSNEMKDMGGLRKHLPITHVTFLIACLAIAGIPPLSGFVSKDEIVTAAYQFSTGMGIWMTVTAGFTAFYMFRLYFRIFWGKEYRGEVKPKESPRSMTYPLIFLALITLVGGFIPFGQFVTADGAPYTIKLNSTVAIISVVVALVGIGLATLLYRKEEKRASWLPSRSSGLYKAAYNRFYIDEAYLFVTKKIIFNNISRPLAWFDRHVIDGAMNGLAWITNRASHAIKGFQSGNLQWYAWVFLLGTLLITLFAIL